MTPETDFSFERDVAPYASRYFDKIGRDPNLTGSQKREIQGMLLSGVEDIRAQQEKLREAQAQGRQRDLAYANGVSALEEARAKRLRMERASSEVAGAQSILQSIMSGTDSPEEKRRKIAEVKVANAASLALNPDAKQVFEIGESALPKAGGGLTPSTIARFAAANVPAEVLATGDPMLIGGVAAEIARDKEQIERARKAMDQDTEESKKMVSRLLNTELKFAIDDTNDMETDWLEPQSTIDATLIVERLGTPQERERFAKLKDAPSDRERATLVNNIQLREQLKALKAGVVSPSDKAKSIHGWQMKNP